ncbi:MAG TPA: hypothetical protein VI258_06415 [Rhodanobacteraceae bacterium]
MRALWLVLALIPYAALAGVDAWLHEKARVVPRTEKRLHAGLALSLIVFLGGAFGSAGALAVVALGALLVLAAADEIGFHRELARNERRVHFASYGALGVFVLVWIGVGI